MRPTRSMNTRRRNSWSVALAAGLLIPADSHPLAISSLIFWVWGATAGWAAATWAVAHSRPAASAARVGDRRLIRVSLVVWVRARGGEAAGRTAVRRGGRPG